MDVCGFVPLKTIANFPRVRMLGLELEDMVECLQVNEFLELKDTDSEVRRRTGEDWAEVPSFHSRRTCE